MQYSKFKEPNSKISDMRFRFCLFVAPNPMMCLKVVVDDDDDDDDDGDDGDDEDEAEEKEGCFAQR